MAEGHSCRREKRYTPAVEFVERNSGQRPAKNFTSFRTVLPVWPSRPRPASQQAVIPVFIPFRGCPIRCVFCAQDVQTGRHGTSFGLAADSPQTGHGLEVALTAAREALTRRFAQGGGRTARPAELAFYGGTFTAMPERELSACLDFAAEALERGWINAFRCSTRPDSVPSGILRRLRDAGCATVELGVQSFGDAALAASRRGYTESVARAACARVREAGLRLGVQLLPGMPGHAPEQFLVDVAAALETGADMLRFYPCLVLEGTELAALWRKGAYAPWSLDVTLAALARGWLLASAAAVPVIRMGLAPEPGLERAVLAGPVDASLGSRVMGHALLLAVIRALDALGADRPRAFDLHIPQAAQGCLWGAKAELRAQWAALGLRRAVFTEARTVTLAFDALARDV